MGNISVNLNEKTLVAAGVIGYEQAAEFVRQCDGFLKSIGSGSAVMDLSAAEELVSPCLTAVYVNCRTYRPAGLTIRVPARMSRLFLPGQDEGLFTVEPI